MDRLRTFHYWLVIATGVLAGLVVDGKIPPGKWMTVVMIGIAAMKLLAVELARKWQPPVESLPLPPPPKAGEQ